MWNWFIEAVNDCLNHLLHFFMGAFVAFASWWLYLFPDIDVSLRRVAMMAGILCSLLGAYASWRAIRSRNGNSPGA